MALRISLVVSAILATSVALAAGTGPTYPDESRQNPLDTHEPEQPGSSRGDESEPSRPSVLEAPPGVPPAEPADAPSPPYRPDIRKRDNGGSASRS